MIQMKKQDLIELIEEDLRIMLCEFEPQIDNNLNCAICNERKWASSHVALEVVSSLLSKTEKNAGLKELKDLRTGVTNPTHKDDLYYFEIGYAAEQRIQLIEGAV